MLRKLALVALLAAISFTEAEASHALGAELTYQCVGQDANGNGLYRIRLSFYYDCNGLVSAPANPDIDIISSCLQMNVTLTQQPAPPIEPPFDQFLSPYEIPIYCEESNCMGGTLSGLQEYIYLDTFALPPCSDYIMSFSEGNRSAAIETIIDPDGEEIYVEAFLNSEEAPCNSSPVFDLPARGFLCLDQDNSMVQTATDIDGDLLVYSLYTPLVAPNEEVVYINPYTFNSPIENNYLNFVDGVISIWPTEEVVTVMGVLVEEYRNGVLIGSVMRDMQVRVVANCPVNPVGIFEYDGIVGSEPDSVFLCTQDTFNLTVFLDSLNSGSLYTLQVNNLQDFEGAEWEVVPHPTDSGSVIGLFTWVPNFGNSPTQTLVLTAFDDSCPIVGYRNFTFRFYSQQILADGSTDFVGVACMDSVLLETVLADAIPPITYEWNTGESNPSIFGDDGTYWVNITDSAGCSATDTFQLYTNNYPVAEFTIEDVCEDIQINLENLSVEFAEPGVTPLQLTGWDWNFGDNIGTSNQENPNYTYETPGTYTINLNITNENGCEDSYSATLTVNPHAVMDVSVAPVCNDSTSKFINNTQIVSGNIVDWQWDFDDNGATSTEQSPEHEFSGVGEYNVTLTAISDEGCENDTTITAQQVQQAKAGFDYVIEPSCETQNARIFLTNTTEDASSTLWDFQTRTDTSWNTVYDTEDGFGPIVSLYANAAIPGCADTVTVDFTNVWLTIDFDSLDVGNVITPNFDGLNDCLAPYYHDSYAECYHLTVFNRWGLQVYDSHEDDTGYCWGGTDANGNLLETGIYYFVAEVNDYQKSGSVSLFE